MSAAIVTIHAKPVPVPPVVWQKIAAFLSAGTTGQIILDVKEGRILAYKLTEAGRVPAGEVDSNGCVLHDSLQ